MIPTSEISARNHSIVQRSDNPDSEFEKDEEFWFEDGNTVLISRDVGFRIHRGIVSRHSEVFRDLFTLPQPTNAEKVHDCPVVSLSDSPMELRILLRAIYNGQRYAEFWEVATVVRLSQKYLMEELYEDGLACLKTCLTDDFNVWDRISRADDCSSPVMHFDFEDAIAAVNLARLTHTDSMLPIVLYLCCQLDSEALVRGIVRPDGIVEQLSPEDLMRYIDAAVSLSARNTSRHLLLDVSPDCACRSICFPRLQQIIIRLFNTPDVLESCDVLSSADSTIDSFDGLCTECISCLKTEDLERRLRCWDELPSLMDVAVPGWGSGDESMTTN
ncbi:hypothetical protein BKA93DRAFT_738642 [Sparassis latifolia]